jgi:hypothetical protein
MEAAAAPLKDEKGRFLQGVSGNVVGRPIGSRNKLGEAFLADFYADWKKHGAAAVRKLRETDIVAYVKIAALLEAKRGDDAASAGNGVTVVNVITGVRG